MIPDHSYFYRSYFIPAFVRRGALSSYILIRQSAAMCSRRIFVLLSVLLTVSSLVRQQLHFKRRLNLLWSSPLYDPFESDPVLKQSVQIEIESIKPIDTKSILTELKELGVSSKSIVDRADLETLLSKARIRTRLRQIAAQDAESKEKVQRANRIADEIEKIKSAGMAERTIIDELHSLFAKVDVNGNLVQQLALARLGLLNTTSSSSAALPLPEPVIGVIEEFRDTYGRFRSEVDDVGVQTTAEIGKILDGVSSSKEVRGVREFTSNIGLTKAEQMAKGIITSSSSSSDYDDLDTPFPGDLTRGAQAGRDDKIRNDVSRLTKEDLENLMAEAENHDTFDDIMHWAIHRPRSLLVRLLQMRGETVPKYAPRSALAGMLSDSIIVQKVEENGLSCADTDTGADDRTSNNQVDATAAATTKKTQSSKKPRKPLSVSYTGPQSTLGTRPSTGVKRGGRSVVSNLNAYSFEKDIFSRFTEMFRETVDHFIDGDDLIPNMPHMPNLADIPNVTFMASVKLLTFSVYSVLHGFIVSLAKWAGGKSLPSQYVIFGVCTYNLAFRKGLISFFASFLVLRVMRALLAVFGALTGADSTSNTEEDDDGDIEAVAAAT